MNARLSCLLLIVLCAALPHGRDAVVGARRSGGGALPTAHGALSPAEEERIGRMLARNLRALDRDGRLPAARPGVTSLRFPLRSAHTLVAPAYHALTNFVDHAAAAGVLSDYYCYGRTYDTPSYNHTGTDFAAWPFGWLRMDQQEIFVVAAADGVLIAWEDGADDRSCVLSSQPWNAAYVRHDDGTVAWYGHLKRGSVTSKPVGSRIAAGDVLGVVGSSGSSTGPHLHFELRTAENAPIDPYFDGSPGHDCNPTAVASRWESQPPYYDGAVLQVTVGDAPPEFPTCPNPETPHVRSEFTLDPAAGATIYFSVYYRDLLFGQTTEYAVYRPDGTLYSAWSNAPGAGTSYYWWTTLVLPSGLPAGTWRVRVTHAGAAHDAWFNVDDPIFVVVTEPTASEWPIGRAREIRWMDNLGGRVRVELWRAGAYVATIEAAGDSDGTAGYTMSAVPCGADYAIRVTDAADSAHFAESAPFRVTGCVYVPFAQR